MPITHDFSGQGAIVTGGSNGIGRAIAERLRDAGAKVTVWDLVPPAFEGVSFAEADIADSASVCRALQQTVGQGGDISILVNNAGLTGPSAPVLEADPDQWRNVVSVNLFGLFEVCRQVVPVMRRTGYGRVVNMASLAGKEGTPHLSAYSAAKAGVIAFTKSFAKELADSDIRVNAIAPAAVQTDLLGQMAPDVVQAMIAKSPLGRLGTVDEIAEIALFLCSDACSFNLGATFDASGGRATY